MTSWPPGAPRPAEAATVTRPVTGLEDSTA
jgi:hypothetical protein